MFQTGLMGYKHKQKIKPSHKISQTVDATSKALTVNFQTFPAQKVKKKFTIQNRIQEFLFQCLYLLQQLTTKLNRHKKDDFFLKG